VSGLFYRILIRLSRVFGLWLIKIVATFVAAGYFLFLPRRTWHGVRFYRALFPQRGLLAGIWCAWRQYQDFASVYSERLEIERRSDIRFESHGDAFLAEAKAGGRGVILLMSHFGRWEIGARLLSRRHTGVTLVMGGEDDGGARAGVDRDLRDAGLGVVTIPAGEGKAFDILAAVQVLRQGGIVSLAADRAFGDARVLRMPFLGHTVAVAAAPFALALVSGAPLIPVFAVKVGPRHYRFRSHAPLSLVAPNRQARQSALEGAAAAYLDQLRAMIEAYPEQWQSFGRFFLEPIERVHAHEV
jgi:lauroyl/myristoyl acyltransferase